MASTSKKNLADSKSEASVGVVNTSAKMMRYHQIIGVEVEREELSGRSERMADGFSADKATRSTAGSTLERDMVLMMPNVDEEYAVYKTNLGENDIEFALIPTNKGVIRLFPAMFQRVAIPVDDQCIPIPGQRIVSKGTACEEYAKYSNIRDAMNSLRGHKIRVMKVEPVNIRKFGTINEITTTNVYTLDFVK